ncbi:peptidase family S58-domain-containing protein [Aspergillus pseudoustus]|uniref:Peptidase family S58-domain-containing protein n=1 Tax=Aspergillus pseudoustus TaxID=1810923 RepID=A0ABR4KEA9_9EURO
MMTSRPRIRDLGYSPGKFPPGPKNSILDVKDVSVGQITLHEGTDIHTGLTVILPRKIEELHVLPCYAATHDLNGMGELTGTHGLTEWGFFNGPIALTNTLSVGKVYDGLFLWQFEQALKAGQTDLEASRRLNIPVVGETYDGLLNDISASVIDKNTVYSAIEASKTQSEVLEGNHGGGTAMRCHGYKGGTGTSSRIVPGADKDYTLGVLVQANHGQKPDLRIGNVPIGELLIREGTAASNTGADTSTHFPKSGKAAEGSIIVVIITDAPLLPHQLRRIAQHAGMGITQVGGHSAGRNFSGEIFLALSTGTSPNELASHSSGFDYLPPLETQPVETVKNEVIDSLFYATSEATEEAILNALCKAETLTGFKGRIQPALPVDRVKELLDKYMVKLEAH